MNTTFLSRFIIMILGNLFIGFAVTLFRIADIGADPFTTFILGIQSLTVMSYGITSIIVNFIIIVPMIIYGRDLIGWGTFINMIGIGLISDGFMFIYLNLGIAPEYFVMQLIIAVFGVVILAFGASLYITAALGVSPYDGVGIIVERLTEQSVRYASARVIQDVIAVVVGIIFSATFGIATLLAAFLTGPLITFFNQNISSRLFTRLDKSFKH